MAFETKTLGELLSDPRIEKIASNAIRSRNLKEEPVWDMPLEKIRSQEFFSSDIGSGFERLYQAAETDSWYYPLYTEEECVADAAKKGVNFVWLPSDQPGADDRPFIFLVPGGGFVNVWNLTEGWPIAAQFNRLGYHVFVLTYQVEAEKGLLKKDMDDFARALQMIRNNKEQFHIHCDQYITCGFSAGGYLICLWNTELGYSAYNIPGPAATFPIYPVVTLKEEIRYGVPDLASAIRLYGCSLQEASQMVYEIPDHVEGFPPAAIFLAAEDELVNPENSKMLARSLEKQGIPCLLEIGPTGGHGFADGSGMCMEGWTGRAISWYESL